MKKINSKIKLIYIDLFCGFGGTTFGVEEARDENGDKIAKVVACVNHDENAINSHYLVSEGCKYCYMMRDFGKRPQWQEVNGTVYRVSKSTFEAPLVWHKKREKGFGGRRLKVFTSSLTDVFHPSIDVFRHEMWEIIKKCPDFDFQILTKRSDRMIDCLPDDWGEGYDNVWLGVSIESDKVLHRIEDLHEVDAKVKFLSVEPLLGEIDLRKYLYREYVNYDNSPFIEGESYIDWVIIGGESGNENGKWLYRPMEIEWAKKVIKDCREQNVSVFVKQLGTYASKIIIADGYEIGRHGVELDNLLKELQFLNLREFPV